MEVPIDLKECGWSETYINYISLPEIQGVLALNQSNLKMVNEALTTQSQYKKEIEDEILKSYSIVNEPNKYTAPGGRWKMSLGFGNFKIGTMLIAGIGAILGYKWVTKRQSRQIKTDTTQAASESIAMSKPNIETIQKFNLNTNEEEASNENGNNGVK